MPDTETLEAPVEVILLDEGTPVADGTRYEVAVMKREVVEKASAQASAKPSKQALTWAEPRMAFSQLLYFFDVNTWHRACIDLKAQLIGGLGWQLVTEDADKSEDDTYRALHALFTNPQAERTLGEQRDSLTEILKAFVTDWKAVGNAYLELPRNALGQVAEIYHVRAATVRRDKKTAGGYHQIRSGQVRASFRGWGADADGKGQDRNELIHLKEYDPQDDYYGMPSWLASLAAQLLDRTAVEYNTYLFKNGLLAHFAIIVEGGKLDTNEINGIKRYIQQNASGVNNAGRGMIIQHQKNGIKIRIEKLNIDLKDLLLDKLRVGTRDETVSAHRVPPRLLGIMHAGALGGGGEVEGQLKIFLESVVRPDQARLEALINNTIVASYGGDEGLSGVKWRFKLREMDVTNRASDAVYYEKALDPDKGWMERGEVREELALSTETEEDGGEHDDD